jgi:transposase-like protein
MARMTATGTELFKGRHFDQQVIILCVRWYLSYKLSSRDLADMMGERGIELAHTTILRWVQRYVPEFEKRWSRYARSVGGSWRCDETYVKVKGRWTYLYRAVDKQGRTVDFLLTAKRDVAAAKRFFQKAMNGNGTPRVITLDAYAASHRAVRELKAEGKDAEASRGPLRASILIMELNKTIAASNNGSDRCWGLSASIQRQSPSAELNSQRKSGSTNSRPESCPGGRRQFRQSGRP